MMRSGLLGDIYFKGNWQYLHGGSKKREVRKTLRFSFQPSPCQMMELPLTELRKTVRGARL